jgi:ParB family chromosome partitioning protein
MSDDMKPKARGLGRGLNALFDDDEIDSGAIAAALSGDGNDSTGADAVTGKKAGIQALGVEQLAPGSMQPRSHFDKEAMDELAGSIRQHGVLQPIVVRQKRDLVTKDAVDGMYEIIAGERRWRAAQLAQLHEVPVIIREFDDAEAMQIALIENLQREDLDPVEEALGYKRLMDEHNFTQAQLADLLGRSRSHIANMVRLLGLPEPVLELVRTGDLSAGHARCLVTFDNPKKLAEKIIAEGWSVRETERYIAHVNRPKDGGSDGAKSTMARGGGKQQKDADTIALENDLSKALGMRLTIETVNDQRGFVRIDFQDMAQLNGLLDTLVRGAHQSAGSDEEEGPAKRLMG